MLQFSLFLIVLLNLLCVGANLPVLPEFNKALGADNTALGVVLLAFGLPRALVSPFWGMVSDRVGRKPIMVVGTIGALFGSVLWIITDNWWMLLLSRLVDGLLSAQAVIAASIITDALPREKRTVAFGLMGAAVSLGLSFGPLWGGLLCEWKGPEALGYVFLLLQGISLMVVLFLMPETLPRENRSKAPFSWASHTEALRLPGASTLYKLSFFASLVVGTLTLALPHQSGLKLGWEASDFAWGFATVGLLGAICQGGLLRVCLRYASEGVLVGWGLALITLAQLIPGVYFSQTTLICWLILTTIGGSLMLPCVKGLLSQVPTEQAGSVMGINQSVQNLGRSMGPALATAGIALGYNGEFLLPGFVAIGLCVWYFLRRS